MYAGLQRQPREPVLALYLRVDGRFLLAGSAPGLGESMAAGSWRSQENRIRLTGWACVRASSHAGCHEGKFERMFEGTTVGYTPVLSAHTDKPSWGLLGSRGPLTWVGDGAAIGPRGLGLPESHAQVDRLIAVLVQREFLRHGGHWRFRAGRLRDSRH